MTYARVPTTESSQGKMVNWTGYVPFPTRVEERLGVYGNTKPEQSEYPLQIVVHMINSATMIATLAMIYGAVQRSNLGPLFRNMALGICFGLGAATIMQQPLKLDAGAIIDSRALFLGFAGAFLSPVGAATALFIGACARLSINVSPAALVGVASMVAATTMGYLWSAIQSRLKTTGKKPLLILGLLISTPVFLVYLLPAAGDPSRFIPIFTVYNVGGAVIFGTIIENQLRRAKRERAAQMDAVTDPLTGLLNRRSFEPLFHAAASRPGTRGTALILVDVDHFKSINDRFGHGAGDEVLKSIAAALRKAVRASESILRIGGEEFAIILTDIAEKDARDAAERVLRSLRMSVPINEMTVLQLSASIGLHHSTQEQVSLKSFYRAADENLYRAKLEGRDRVVFHRSETETEEGRPSINRK